MLSHDSYICLQLQQLSIADGIFTRNPWPLAQLSSLPRLSCLSVAWDTGLWAPGQVLQETEALQVTTFVCIPAPSLQHIFLCSQGSSAAVVFCTVVYDLYSAVADIAA